MSTKIPDQLKEIANHVTQGVSAARLCERFSRGLRLNGEATRLVVTTLVQEFHDFCLQWCEVVERLTLEGDGLVIVREL